MYDRRGAEMRAQGVVAAAGGRGAYSVTTPRAVMTMPRGILGVQLTDVESPGIAAITQQKADHGVFVTNVPTGSPGAKLGLRAGDVIITVGDVDVTSVAQLHRTVLLVGPTKPLTYVVMREGRTIKLFYDPR
jgi:S1-C subfamily serine protease